MENSIQIAFGIALAPYIYIGILFAIILFIGILHQLAEMSGIVLVGFIFGIAAILACMLCSSTEQEETQPIETVSLEHIHKLKYGYSLGLTR